jgi:hypothetical protein
MRHRRRGAGHEAQHALAESHDPEARGCTVLEADAWMRVADREQHDRDVHQGECTTHREREPGTHQHEGEPTVQAGATGTRWAAQSGHRALVLIVPSIVGRGAAVQQHMQDRERPRRAPVRDSARQQERPQEDAGQNQLEVQPQVDEEAEQAGDHGANRRSIRTATVLPADSIIFFGRLIA